MNEYICKYKKYCKDIDWQSVLLFGNAEFLTCMAVRSHMECKLTVALKTYPFFFTLAKMTFFFANHKIVFDEFC